VQADHVALVEGVVGVVDKVVGVVCEVLLQERSNVSISVSFP
jgi:hypothetical protein